MNITKVQIHLHRKNESPVKAFVDIILDNEFIVRGLVIVKDDKDTYYVNMPNRERNGTRQDVAHPITESCRRYIEDTVLNEYESLLKSMGYEIGTDGAN
jgi:stage V sporulation protein G